MQLDDYKYFLDNTADLFKQYGAAYLAIKDKTVLGTYQTFDTALEHTLKEQKLGTFIIQECLEDKAKSTVTFQANVSPVPMRCVDVK
jgi:hypothetical protein